MSHRASLFVLQLVIPVMAFAQSVTLPDAPDPDLTARVEALAETFPALTITVQRRGDTVWEYAHGHADLASARPATNDTLFNVYSIAKMLTGFAFLRLAYEDPSVLDMPVREVSEGLPSRYDGILINHLLTHRSGIRHYQGRRDWIRFSEKRCADTGESIDYFADDRLKSPPGKRERYSTFAMVVASHVLMELQSSPSFAGTPNQLLPIDSPWQLDAENADKATPYVTKGSEFVAMPAMSAECKFGGGGIIASSRQLAQAGSLMTEGHLGPAQALRERVLGARHDEGRYSFAMGVGVSAREETEGMLYANMGGGSPGGRGYLLVFLEPGISVGIAANAEGDGDAVAGVAFALARWFALGATADQRVR